MTEQTKPEKIKTKTYKGARSYLLRAANTGDKSTRSRVISYIPWLDQQRRNWLDPDLGAWRDALLAEDKARAAVGAYLSSVRGAYTRLIENPRFRDLLYGMARANGAEGPPDQKASVDELSTRIDASATH